MSNDLDDLLSRAQSAVADAADLRALDDVRVRYLGKSGEFTARLKQLGKLPPDERKAAGQQINELKSKVQTALASAAEAAQARKQSRELAGRPLDASLPARLSWIGSLHPVTQTRRELETIFRDGWFDPRRPRA